jgi:hypothetical protein
MLLKKLFADNIFYVSQGGPTGSLIPLSVVGRADSPFAVNKSARFSGKVSTCRLLRVAEIKSPVGEGTNNRRSKFRA